MEAANAIAPMEISPISSGLLRMHERLSNAPDAQAGQLVAELPTQSQSWQRYADFNGMCCSMGEVIDIPPVLGCAEWSQSENELPISDDTYTEWMLEPADQLHPIELEQPMPPLCL